MKVVSVQPPATDASLRVQTKGVASVAGRSVRSRPWRSWRLRDGWIDVRARVAIGLRSAKPAGRRNDASLAAGEEAGDGVPG
ncbi:hypothetical protein GCM10010129_07850 [Streptomyces fumigatiscleroticus]|nr:hypothetical protein GCM10010129_07850 [Streptomyces fumigatiscleroticus]